MNTNETPEVVYQSTKNKLQNFNNEQHCVRNRGNTPKPNYKFCNAIHFILRDIRNATEMKQCIQL